MGKLGIATRGEICAARAVQIGLCGGSPSYARYRCAVCGPLYDFVVRVVAPATSAIKNKTESGGSESRKGKLGIRGAKILTLGAYERARHAFAENADQHRSGGAERLARKWSISRDKKQNRVTRTRFRFLWWGKLDSDQRSQ